MQIGSVTTGVGVVTTININYVPAYLFYYADTQFQSIKVTVEGDGTVLDVDATGLDVLDSIGREGREGDSYLIPLATGFIPNKVTTIEITNSAAQAPALYGFSLQRGYAYIRTQRNLVLANSEYDVKDFVFLGLNSPQAADIYTVKYGNGLTQRYDINELRAVLSLFTNVVTEFAFSNLEQSISVINVNPSTNRNIYVTRFTPVADMI